MEFKNYHALNEKNYQLYKEKTERCTPLFSITKYHSNVSELLPFYPIHWHEEMEIIKVQSGRGVFCIDGKIYVAERGDIVILRPFVMHSINCLDSCNMTVDALVFNLRLLTSEADTDAPNYFAPILNEKHSVPCIVRATDDRYLPFNDSMQQILTCDTSGENVKSDVKDNMYRMFYAIYNNRQVNASPSIAEDKRLYTIRRALEYIRAEYMNEITIENVAKHCGYSEFYLMKLFKQYTGASCVDYVNHYRLTVAGRQLRDTDDDIATIAYQVGYNNVSYFNRQFKKLYGMTPREFRASPAVRVD